MSTSRHLRVFLFWQKLNVEVPPEIAHDIDQSKIEAYTDGLRQGSWLVARQIPDLLLGTVENSEVYGWIKLLNSVSNPSRLNTLEGKTLLCLDPPKHEVDEFLSDWTPPAGIEIEIQFYTLRFEKTGGVKIERIETLGTTNSWESLL